MPISALKAQEIIGRTTILGKEVEIFDNQTWRYATPDKEFSDCEKLQLDIYFCNVSDWKKLKHPVRSMLCLNLIQGLFNVYY